jgi:heterodisulfide reductase subunit D
MAANAKLHRGIKPLIEYRNDVWKCVRCGICRMTSPEKLKSKKWSDNCIAGTRYKLESYYASGRHELIRALTNDPPDIEITEQLVKTVFACSACGNCQWNCNQMKELEPLNAGIALREYLIEKGHAPLPVHVNLIKSIENYDNPWMLPRTARDKWAKKVKVKDLNKEKAEVLYWVGCTGSYDPSFRDVVGATVKILDKAGVDFGILGQKEKCCGSIVLRVGARKRFNAIKAPNVEQLNKLGIKTLVTACSGCYSTLAHEYAAELNFEVIHIVKYLDRLITEGKLKFTREVNKVVTYHDPCHIGRYSEMYDEPRRIINAIPGIKFKEMERIREYSWCCGAGAGVRSAFTDLALWAATKRIEEARDTGAEAIVSACPFCEQNIGEALKTGNYGMEMLDLLPLVMDAVE